MIPPSIHLLLISDRQQNQALIHDLLAENRAEGEFQFTVARQHLGRAEQASAQASLPENNQIFRLPPHSSK